jgi:enediyne biosynthesis protein E4
VTLYWNDQKQVQEVSGGSGFAAQNDRRLHFGLGKDAKIEKAEVRWPSGRSQVLDNITAGQLYKVKEPQ